MIIFILFLLLTAVNLTFLPLCPRVSVMYCLSAVYLTLILSLFLFVSTLWSLRFPQPNISLTDMSDHVSVLLCFPHSPIRSCNLPALALCF